MRRRAGLQRPLRSAGASCFPVGVDAGTETSAVLLGDGRVLGFGASWALGLPAPVATPTELDVEPLAQIALGYDFGLGITDDGTLLSWGGNGRGQRGLGHRNPPPGRTVVMDGRFRAVAANQWFAFAIREDGALFAFGSNEHGKLGLGIGVGEACAGEDRPACRSDADCSAPARCEGGSPGSSGSCSSRATRCVPTPGQVDVGSRFLSIAAGWQHAVALRDDGAVMTWGLARDGQLGITPRTTRGCGPCYDRPQVVGAVLGGRQVAAGATHSLVLDEERELWTFGWNSNTW